MKRQSPAVGRIVSILNFFVEHPQQAFTLTQIVKSLRLSRATCHALLLGLVEAGYLYRGPDKSYVLGPALIALAINAQKHFSPLAVARQEMRVLADELDVVCAALFREGDEVVVRDRAASLTHLGWLIPTREKYPLYPWGSVFLAPLAEDRLEEEMDKLKPLDEAARESLRQFARFAHQHGFVVGVREGDPQTRDLAALSRPTGRFLTELKPDEEYWLNFLIGPVMNEKAEVAMGIALYGFANPLTGAAVVQIGERLVGACGRITSLIAGKGA